jgi:hypothetical protein
VFFVALRNILIKAKGILKKPDRLTTFGRSNIKKYNYILTVIYSRKRWSIIFGVMWAMVLAYPADVHLLRIMIPQSGRKTSLDSSECRNIFLWYNPSKVTRERGKGEQECHRLC